MDMKPANLVIQEHASDKYSPRTWHNAKTAHLTLAFAVDYTTAGERLTKKASDGKYLALPLYGDTKDPMLAAQVLGQYLQANHANDAIILNIAGNGLYTLNKHGWTQEQANFHVYQVLAEIHAHHRFTQVISGGQTGIDMAGIVAAHTLDIEAVATLPKGFIQRGVDELDVTHTEAQIREQVRQGRAAIERTWNGEAPVSETAPSRKIYR